MGEHRTLKFDHIFSLGWGHRTKYQENHYGRWVGGWFLQDMIPLCGSISQAGTCQILSLVWKKQNLNKEVNILIFYNFPGQNTENLCLSERLSQYDL